MIAKLQGAVAVVQDRDGRRGDAGHVPPSECEGRVIGIAAPRRALPLLSNLRFIPTVSSLCGLHTLDKGGDGRDCGAE